MTAIQLECNLQNGIHARPAALAAKKAREYSCRVFIVNEDSGKRADARSVTSIMALGIKRGGHLRVECSGSDEREAAGAMAELLSRIE